MNPFKTYTILFFFIFISLNVHSNVLLQPPKQLSHEEIEELAHNWETSFTWAFFHKIVEFTCCYENEEASFILRVSKVPVCSHKFQYIKHIKEYIDSRHQSQRDYYFADPLIENNSQTHHINFNELCDLLQAKKFVFYTGAGVSAAGNVATMGQLEQRLGLDDGVKNFLKKIYLDSESVVHNFATFCESAVLAEPTDAHCALHEIACHIGTSIVTENVDLLQHKTGSVPLHTHGPELAELKASDLKEIDTIVTIGLSYDDCGFLRYYKQHNPEGKIIAINLAVPSYLSTQDFFVQEDAQTILPVLAEVFLCL